MLKKVGELRLGRAQDARGVTESASANGAESHFPSAPGFRLGAKGWQVFLRIALIGAMVGVLGLSLRPAAATITPGPGAPGLEELHQGANGANGGWDWEHAKGYDGGNGSDGDPVSISPLHNFILTSQDNITTQSAPGIYGESIGGTGGEGGSHKDVPCTGGNGGNGGNGGSVKINNSYQVTTTTYQNIPIPFPGIGIYGVSAGGNGGAGGDGHLTGSGGNGGNGGAGGEVTINNFVGGIINTDGVQYHGIMAQSLGGYGGAGGSGGGWWGGGGAGANAGHGSDVSVTNEDSITTQGFNSYAIFAQSIGGFSGNGGSGEGIVGWGGDAHSAGYGGAVTVNNTGGSPDVRLTTSGAQSDLIRAQSIGGGGGSAGESEGLVALGGSGSAGGAGGAVTVTNNYILQATGAGSFGIYAQSAGGGGGHSDSSVGLAAIGGSGGGGGDGGSVSVFNYNKITTTASAILAQSLGGGGGNGGLAVSGAAAIGGSSGKGGNAGAVTVVSNGNLTTSELFADAIFAQSLGGGGGKGGAAVTGDLNGIGFSMGASGGPGGNGNTVTVSAAYSKITTSNFFSAGIFAQSAGGGGGAGGYSITGSASVLGSAAVALGGSGGAGGAGDNVAVSLYKSTITTAGEFSTGIYAQSLGGGGGNGGFSIAGSGGILGGVAAGLGGSGDGGGDAGNVSVMFADSNITTQGINSFGIFAQSLGGGGGNGGFSTAGSAGIMGLGISAALGGSGKGGGNAGNVSMVLTNSNIATQGINSSGIHAQSLGGGGGHGGFSIAGSGGMFGGLSATLGGSGGGGGNAGNVSVDLTDSNITTQGINSFGIFAQSLGGGGGSGGFSVSGAAGMTGAAVGLGGTGGNGGTAGTVAVHITSTGAQSNITTSNYGSCGILAQSVGGGGGVGGGSISGAGSLLSSTSVSLGGTGGGGGSGNTVTCNITDLQVTTAGDFSSGIAAQSVGGGGGHGGFSISGSLGMAYAVAVGLGGKGGVAGSGDKVTVEINTSEIDTSGDHAQGLLAQSIGGGGGNAGYSVAGSAGALGASLGLGGTGGSGGSGNDVSVTFGGIINTQGDHSGGILAQSIGGGGGNGGFSVAGTLAGGALSGSVGGSGGPGSNSGNVTVSTSGAVTTKGDHAAGIMAQSIGGGGGNGGFSVAGSISGALSASLSLGGSGLSGGDAGQVNLTSASSVATTGNHSHGLVAQSIGGGGGNGGFSVSASITIPAGGSGAAASVSLGGSAAIGGNSAAVTATSTGDTITTEGNNAKGILAQSIGGGGGSGGFSGTLAFTNTASAAVSLGGSGAGGGTSSTVTVTNSSLISTAGDYSEGIFAQSLGGGGGNGGFSISASGAVSSFSVSLGGSGAGGGNSDDVIVTNTGDIYTKGYSSGGILAQSTGGGGGNGGFSVAGSLSSVLSTSVSLGAHGGPGGTGGAVDVNNSGSISTLGDGACGILAQSIGGGGGNGGFSGSLAISGSGGTGVAVSLGGKGGSGGDAASVTVSSSGTAIVTQGFMASGIFAQSIGGGGGNGGSSGALALSGTVSASVTLGGGAGSGGTSGQVSVTNSSQISTAGFFSAGIFAQSIGGGGGNGGMSIAASGGTDGGVGVSLGGAGAPGADGNNVTVVNTGSITTQSEFSIGILAQSVGGGGGNGGFSVSGDLAQAGAISVSLGGNGGKGGDAGYIDLQSSGDISTAGDGSIGIAAQSIGGGGGNGGFSVAGSISRVVSAGVSLGGTGAHGGMGSTVNLTSDSNIATQGNLASGILAQSIGGGGGNGGFSVSGTLSVYSTSGSVGFSMGGTGGTGGTAASVSVVSNGTISTVGAFSSGITAQSIGGGGGNGGFSASGALAIGKQSLAVAVALGGSGGRGNTSSWVEVGSTGNISTQGDGSQGILAQSIGGGGGNGGFGATLSGAGGVSKVPISNVSFSIGGDGGSGGDSLNNDLGWAVEVNSTGSLITTSGYKAEGILAQSIGGGGGNGAISLALGAGTGSLAFATVPKLNLGCLAGGGGKAGAVVVNNRSNIQTAGDYATGILAQSVGGGGGTGGTRITGTLSVQDGTVGLALGAQGVNGAGGGDADAVTVTDELAAGADSKYIVTAGYNATGILAQSVGGGGGTGGWSIAAGLSTQSSYVPPLVLSFGGNGGAGGAAGKVSVTAASSIYTEGDNSHGIFAQSVGGGGGNGGIAIGVNIATQASKLKVGGLSAVLGGDGGAGSNSEAVTVTSTGSMIQTMGNSSTAIFAQSVGGGGGNGGGSVNVGIDAGTTSGLSVNLGRGGKGGTGGSAGAVTVASSSSLSTGNIDQDGNFLTGNDAGGILAQSVGGGGGNGGFSINVTLSGSEKKFSGGVAVSLGGSGGSGNTSGDVKVTSTGASIITRGDRSQGIFAQSVGGGGGKGGFSISGGISQGQQWSASVGGKGGSGADAGTVQVTNSSSISTGFLSKDMIFGNYMVFGHDAAGIEAQSVGGGGGNGGFSVSGDVSTTGYAPSVSLGGSGGAAGNGAAVTVTNTGAAITTMGDRSAGIAAQSIGGGGGHGGFSVAGSLSSSKADAVFSLGGSGKAGGDAGAVTVNSAATTGIQTQGDDSQGLLAQSIGGGGGNSGFSVAGVLDLGGAGLALSLGGHGGTGGFGSKVTITDTGALILTSGDRSSGIEAQSIGGGGGHTGLSIGAGFGTYGIVPIGLGGKAGVGGNGGEVAVASSSSIQTSGNDSIGILAQSIGAGGGSAGINVNGDLNSAASADADAATSSSLDISLGASGKGSGNGDTVTIVATGEMIVTSGERSSGLVAQSIGGGGGIGWLSATGSVPQDGGTITLGGQDSSGNGGSVSIQNSALISVSGKGSYGILAQSLGGGGGLGYNAALSSGSGISIGGSQSASGNGGTVDITNQNFIITSDDAGYGIIAQSIGGGGGLAGSTGTVSSTGLKTTMPAGNDTNSGDGNKVTITSSGTIFTSGSGACGIVAQSIGGGGGLNVITGDAGSAGGKGAAGDIEVVNSGNIITTGTYAHGIFAQSAAGTGSASNVNVNNYGVISVYGTGAYAIYAVCTGQGGAGPINIFNGDGATIAGSTFGIAPICMIGGNKDNAIINHGTITSAGALTEGSQSTLTNYGAVSGKSFFGDLINHGAVKPGDYPGTMTILGTYTQSTTGVLIAGVASASSYHQVAVSGISGASGASGTVSLAGALAPTIYGNFLPRGNQVFAEVITATGGITGSFERIINQQLTPTLFWQTRSNPNSVDLWVQRNYNNSSLNLNANQRAVATMLNSVSGVTGGDLDTVLNAIDYLPSSASVQNAYKQISPEKAAAFSTLAFAGANLQKRTLSRRITDLRFGSAATGGAGGLGAFNLGYTRGEGLMLAYNSTSLAGLLTGSRLAGVGAKPWGFYLDPALILGMQASSTNQTGFRYTTAGFNAGIDYRVRDDLLVGLASGYSHTGASFLGSGGSVQTNTWPITAYAAYLPQSFYAFGSLGYSLNLFNLERNLSFGGLSRTAKSAPSGNMFNAYGEMGYDLKARRLVLTPAVSLAYSRLWVDGFTETDAGALNLKVAPQNADSLQTGLGGKIALPIQRNSTTVVPQIYAFYQHEFSNSSRTLDARLSQGGSTSGFQTATSARNFAVLGANFTLTASKNLKVQVDYNAEVGRGNYTAHYVSGGLRYEF
jgi:uncharacterized protein YhjY with autotransporter beta-barrel domain